MAGCSTTANESAVILQKIADDYAAGKIDRVTMQRQVSSAVADVVGNTAAIVKRNLQQLDA